MENTVGPHRLAALWFAAIRMSVRFKEVIDKVKRFMWVNSEVGHNESQFKTLKLF